MNALFKVEDYWFGLLQKYKRIDIQIHLLNMMEYIWKTMTPPAISAFNLEN